MRNRIWVIGVSVFCCSCLIVGCGVKRYHQFAETGPVTGEEVEGWSVAAALERVNEGEASDLEEYTVMVTAEILPSKYQYRLGVDSVEVLQPNGKMIGMGVTRLIFEDNTTERAHFERTQGGLVLPTKNSQIMCRLHVTLFDSKVQKGWQKTVDFLFESDWRKEFWIFKKK